MTALKCKGIVIKTMDYKENDKILWIFTDKFGKISVIAKGAKKSKNRLFNLCLTFCFSELVLYKGKNMYRINEGNIIESFQGFLNDLDMLTYASYICELIDISMVENEPNLELFKLMLTAMYLLKSNAMDSDILLRAYETNVLKHTGYGLNLDFCSICHKKIVSADYINLQYYGGVCDECMKSQGIHLNRDTYSALKFLNTVPMEKVYRLNANDKIKNELQRVLYLIISNNYAKSPKSLQLFEFIKESEKNE
ncbi:DNA repair protein RecO [Clostridium oryzae]|uniref:DNA repair protein RecO n=1 Tax=Clostridium oryzae TaxID=1450648 RepID=UPI0011176B04|nr:DNA repair protein RecO [Clostridium oryzae]